jgi:hypothetical protein
MPANPLYALLPISVFPGTPVVALTLTAAVLIPAGFWVCFFWDRMAAKISTKIS